MLVSYDTKRRGDCKRLARGRRRQCSAPLARPCPTNCKKGRRGRRGQAAFPWRPLHLPQPVAAERQHPQPREARQPLWQLHQGVAVQDERLEGAARGAGGRAGAARACACDIGCCSLALKPGPSVSGHAHEQRREQHLHACTWSLHFWLGVAVPPHGSDVGCAPAGRKRVGQVGYAVVGQRQHLQQRQLAHNCGGRGGCCARRARVCLQLMVAESFL